MSAGLLKAIRMESMRGVDSAKNALALGQGWVADDGESRRKSEWWEGRPISLRLLRAPSTTRSAASGPPPP